MCALTPGHENAIKLEWRRHPLRTLDLYCRTNHSKNVAGVRTVAGLVEQPRGKNCARLALVHPLIGAYEPVEQL